MNEIENRFYEALKKIINKGVFFKDENSIAKVGRFVIKEEGNKEGESNHFYIVSGVIVECNGIKEVYKSEGFILAQHETQIKKVMDFLIGAYDIGISFGVEIDGHEWHEKNKEQVRHDKQRERELIKDGYPIVRFTGSEVFINAEKYAVELLDIYTTYHYRQLRNKLSYEKFYNGIKKERGTY